MTVLEYIIFAVVGKLTIYFIQVFPLDHLPLVGKWFRGCLNKLWKCDLCLGFWVYLFLAVVLHANIFNFYVNGINEIIMGMITSFLVHLISLGWKDKFSVLYVE